MAKKTRRRTRRGLRGLKGRRGAPGILPEEIHALVKDIEAIRAEAVIQFKRIAQLQVQLDSILKSLKEMGDRAESQLGRRGKRAKVR